MTTNAHVHPDEQANRLEVAASGMAAMVRQPSDAPHLHAAPGSNEWNALEIMGHCAEMIPYWISQIRVILTATGEQLPRFGRTPDDVGRMAGPESGKTTNANDLADKLEREAYRAAAAIRTFSEADRAKRGVNLRGEEMRVEDVIERFIVSHAEGHLKQMEEALASG